MESAFQTMGLSSQLVLSLAVALGVFMTVLAIAVPALSGNKLKSRMKSVALERDQIRARERAKLAAEKEQSRGLRQQEKRGIASMVVEQLNLRSSSTTRPSAIFVPPAIAASAL